MDLYRIVKDSAGENVTRKVLSSPGIVQLVKNLLLKKEKYRTEGNYLLAELGFTQAAEAYNSRKKLAYKSAFFPDEIIYAFDLVPFAPEVASATASSLGIADRFIKKSEAHSLTKDGCTFHSCVLGGVLEDLFPEPDVILASSHLCDGAPHLFRHISGITNKPMYFLDVPVTDSEDARQYLAEQLKDIVGQLETSLNKKLNQDKLRKTMEISNDTRQAFIDLNKLRRNSCALRAEDALALVYIIMMAQGHPEAAKILTRLKEEVNSLGSMPKDGPRLVWLHLKPYYSNRLMELIQDKFGAQIVFEEMNYISWPPLDTERPFISLADKIISHPSVGPIEKRATAIARMVEDYHADGVVHFSHWGCRQSIGSVHKLKKELQKRNIPFLAVDGDCVDEGKDSLGQVRTRIESFLELLDQRKGVV